MTRLVAVILPVLAASSVSWIPGCEENDDGRIRASGTFEVEQIKVLATAPGELTSFALDEGVAVDKDQVVAQIDDEDLQLKKEEVEAGLAMAQARLKLVQNGARPEDIKQLKALSKEIKLQKNLSETNVGRLTLLHEKGGISKSSLDEAETQRDVVNTKLTQVKWQLKKAKNGAQDEEIDIASASVDQLVAGLKQLDKMIADRTITSPASGTVIDTFAHEAELVTIGQLLATIADMDDMELVVYVSEKDLPRVKVGQKALVSIDAFEDQTFEATVSHIAAEAEFTPSTVQTQEERVKLVFEVKLKVPNPEGYFKPGLPGDVVFVQEG